MFVFRLECLSILQTVLFFICASEMSSDDESAPSPEFGASSSKDCAPVTPIASESDSDGGAKKKV